MTKPAIEVDSLRKNYGPVLAVDNVSFQVAPGELVGLLGPNGAGKSTTMRILTTWLPASSGYASVCGFDVYDEPLEVRKRIGYLPESVPIYPEMRVEEYLAYRARLKGLPRATRQARIDYVLERCRIREVRRRLAGTLSKGYRQRVGLADTMLADPEVLILDEPTSGLDPIQIQETLATIRELAGQHTVLLSTHILSEVEAICNRVIIINRGTLAWDGKLSELANERGVYSLEVRGPALQVSDWIRGQAGVVRVNTRKIEDNLTQLDFETSIPGDHREDYAKQISGKGWTLRKLDLRQRQLPDLYFEVVRARNAPPDFAMTADDESVPEESATSV